MMEENLDPDWMGTEEEEIYKENILDHYKHPRNFKPLETYTFKHREINPVCGDAVELFVRIKDNRVNDATFTGKGCAISIAATSMLTGYLKDKTREEIKAIDKEKIMEMLGIRLGVVRVKCGLLCLKTLYAGLQKETEQ